MQNVSTIVGANYNLGFDFWKTGGGVGSAAFRVQVISGGVSVVDRIVSNSTAFVVGDFEYNFTALGANSTVVFTDVSTATASLDAALDNVRLFLDNSSNDSVSSGSGNDVIHTGGGDDWINGGAGNVRSSAVRVAIRFPTSDPLPQLLLTLIRVATPAAMLRPMFCTTSRILLARSTQIRSLAMPTTTPSKVDWATMHSTVVPELAIP